jgi:cellulose synthase/poly-beta-1,6-N-acetylglucosamine synthase-like glycosyltransferase
MAGLLSSWLAIFSGLLAVPTTMLCLEIVASAVWRGVPMNWGLGSRRRITVLVPAHNESAVIACTLSDVRAQIGHRDRLLVVADNCDDETASVAKAAGAEVVERHDTARIGKGYALDFGLRHLESAAPDIVVMVDADCRLSDGAIDQLVSTCALTGRPVQGLYLMTAPVGSQINQQVAEFAWRVKNWARPLGLAALGQPCQLMGTGMAFPWDVIRSADLASGSIVEDMKLGLDLATAGHPPLFCPSALVTSTFAASIQGATTQRQRWEQGHIGMILQRVPRLICLALMRGNFGLLALALDLAVPPLSLLGMFIAGMLLIAGLAAFFGLASTPFFVTVANFMAFVFAVALAWLKFGRDVLPPNSLWSIPGYVAGKLGIYLQILLGRMTAQWVRTDRTKS